MAKSYMHFVSAFIKDGSMWCAPRDSNDLVQIDLADWSITKVASFEMVELSIMDYIFYGNNVIWCVLSNADRIISYDILSKEKKSYPLPLFQDRGIEPVFFRNKIWLFPSSISKDVICFDVETKTAEISGQWKSQIVKKGYAGTRGKIFVKDGIAYMPVLYSSEFIAFSLEDGGVSRERLPVNIQMGFMAKKESCYYFTEFDGSSIVRWDIRTDTVERFCHSEQFDRGYKGCMVLDNKILLIDADRFDYFDENRNQIITDCCLSRHCISGVGGRRLFADMVKDGDRVYFLPWMADEMLIYDFSCNRWCSRMLEIPRSVLYDCMKNKVRNGDCLKETSLDIYLDYVVESPK